MDAVNYITQMVDDVLTRRRQHLERRNDFIQIMVDREEEVKDEEKTTQPIETNREQGIVLKKSTLIELENLC